MDVFYHNEWRGMHLVEVRECFRRLTPSEIETLEPGDTIWVDLEPYAPKGKVYGYSLVMITDITRLGDQRQIRYEAGGYGGTLQAPQVAVFALQERKRLLALVRRHGDVILSVLRDPHAVRRFLSAFDED